MAFSRQCLSVSAKNFRPQDSPKLGLMDKVHSYRWLCNKKSIVAFVPLVNIEEMLITFVNYHQQFSNVNTLSLKWRRQPIVFVSGNKVALNLSWVEIDSVLKGVGNWVGSIFSHFQGFTCCVNLNLFLWNERRLKFWTNICSAKFYSLHHKMPLNWHLLEASSIQ